MNFLIHENKGLYPFYSWHQMNEHTINDAIKHGKLVHQTSVFFYIIVQYIYIKGTKAINLEKLGTSFFH